LAKATSNCRKGKAKVSFLNVKFKRVASQGDSSLIDRKEVTSTSSDDE
jgi:hypothetical protein